MSKFKVGDRVTAGDAFGGDWNDLTILEIGPCGTSDKNYRVQRADNGLTGHIHESNLEYLTELDLTKPVYTRAGDKAVILTTNPTPALARRLGFHVAPSDVIVAEIDGLFYGFTAEGQFDPYQGETPMDLTNTPPAPPAPSVTTFFATARHSGSGFLPGLTFGQLRFDDASEAVRIARETPHQWDSVVKVSVSEGKLVDIEHVTNVD